MLVKRLAIFGFALLLLLLSSAATTAFAQEDIGNTNNWLTNSNNGPTTCGLGGVSVTIQPNLNYNEISSTDVAGDYTYQLNIRTPSLYDSTSSLIGYQQSIFVKGNEMGSAGEYL